jgi:GTPase
LLERPEYGERALLLHFSLGHKQTSEDKKEFQSLAFTAGVEVVADLQAHRNSATPKFLVGTGKVEELKLHIRTHKIDVVLIDHELTPRQEINLEKELCVRVIDRTGLILDIFAQRARTHEGKLQVELAQLRHLSTRLVKGWTHLERQKGGIGLRGPGETQLETDRRLVGYSIKRLQKRLDKVDSRRQQGRQYRKKQEMPTVSLVGYTNAGKSTLFNILSGAGVIAEDMLFATLDPTLRKIELPSGDDAILVDTVGFVRDLPHELIAAFQSTLEETRDADLLLHVIDCADPEHILRIEQVNEVLEKIGARDLPIIQIYNKADILMVEPRLDRSENGEVMRIWLSAHDGRGTKFLLDAIAEFLHRGRVRGTVQLDVTQSRLRALLHDQCRVYAERMYDDGSWELDLEIDKHRYERLRQQESLLIHS